MTFDFNKEIYISIDIESDGPIPGENSMLSLGAAAFCLENVNKIFYNDIFVEGKLISTYSTNLELLPNATPNPDTMKFWSDNKFAYDETRRNLLSPDIAMFNFDQWLQSFKPRQCVAVCYPAGYDFTWVYWYLMKFVGKSQFSHSALDIKTLVMGALKTNYRNSVKKNFPKRWFGKSKHSHIALDDAIEQGEIFCKIMNEIL
ncbi:MAG: exonuclease [Candidatus Paceibacterota bacterium]